MSYPKHNYLGSYASFAALWSAHPEGGREGDWVKVGGDEYYWNKYERNWAGSPIDGTTEAHITEEVKGNLQVDNDLYVGGNIHVRGDVYADGEDVPVTPGGGGGGGNIVIDTEIDDKSSNPVENQAIAKALKDKQDKLTSDDTIATINGTDLKYGGSMDIQGGVTIDQSLDTNSPNPVANSAVTTALKDKLEKTSIKAGTGISVSTKVNNGKPEVTINATGGGGGGSNITVVDEEEETVNVGTISFFSDSPSQGVGSYNTLLQQGYVDGKDGVRYHYNPGDLYQLYEDGSFDVVADSQDEGHWVDDHNGRARYNWVDDDGIIHRELTPLPYYGHVLLSKHILYALTSDTAYGVLRVSGPFYARETRVTLNYDSSVISVKAVKSVSVDNSNEKHLSVETTDLPNGSHIDFSYDGHGTTRRYYDSIQLIVTRRGSALDFTDALATEVNFSQGDETTTMRVLFGAATVFYKDGTFNPAGLLTVNSALAQSMASAIVAGKNYLRMTKNQTHVLAENFVIDQTRYNMMYIKLCNVRSDLNSLELVATRAGWKSTISTFTLENNTYYSTYLRAGYALSNMPLFGPYPMFGMMQDYHPEGKGDNANFPTDATVSLTKIVAKIIKNGGPYHVSEIGILTHKEPFES